MTAVVKDREAAEDITATAYAKAFQDLPRFRGECSLHVGLPNRSERGEAAPLTEASVVALCAGVYLAESAEHDHWDDARDRSLQTAKLRTALRTLPSAYRRLLVSHFVNGHSVLRAGSAFRLGPCSAASSLRRGSCARRGVKFTFKARCLSSTLTWHDLTIRRPGLYRLSRSSDTFKANISLHTISRSRWLNDFPCRLVHVIRFLLVLSGTASARSCARRTAGFCFFRTPPPRQVWVPFPKMQPWPWEQRALRSSARVCPERTGRKRRKHHEPEQHRSIPSKPLFLDTVAHGDCVDVMRQMPAASVDLILTDPPYLVNYHSRDGRAIQNDAADQWLKPAFARSLSRAAFQSLLRSFYGWSKADKFLAAWRVAGFRPVGHLVFRKRYFVGYALPALSA